MGPEKGVLFCAGDGQGEDTVAEGCGAVCADSILAWGALNCSIGVGGDTDSSILVRMVLHFGQKSLAFFGSDFMFRFSSKLQLLHLNLIV